MTQEEKDLLLRDLCGRLPYNCMVECSVSEDAKMDVILLPEHISELTQDALMVKPYLRPMSSMTLEEKREYNFTKTLSIVDYPTLESYDWLNAHHFDYRGLIEKGLAIEVTESNNPYEN